MGTSACATCDAKCGNGNANVKENFKNDPTYVAMCKILCETRKEMCEGKHKGKTASNVAEDKAKKSPDLQRAIDKQFDGGKPAVNKHRYVRYNNMPKSWGRTKIAKEVLDRQLDNVMRQIKDKAAKIALTKVGQAAARSWLKLVPILNVASTIYDVYDIASTGVDIYKQIEAARAQYSGDVYSIRPDVAVMGKNGQLKGIYDFKFDGDKWQPGQEEMYNEDLKNSGAEGSAKSVNSKSCGCDGPTVVPRTGS